MTVYILITLAVLLGAGAVYLLKRRQREARTAAVQKVAMRLGFDFRAAPTRDYAAGWAAGFELFEKGTRRDDPANVMQGLIGGQEAILFDYVYYQRSSTYVNGNYSSSETPSMQTVAITKLQQAQLPGFSLKREGFSDRVKDKLGFHDVDIPEAPDFSRDYWLKGEDDAALRSLFRPDLIARLAERGLQKGEAIECREGRLMYFRTHLVKEEEFGEFVDRAASLVEIFDRASVPA